MASGTQRIVAAAAGAMQAIANAMLVASFRSAAPARAATPAIPATSAGKSRTKLAPGGSAIAPIDQSVHVAAQTAFGGVRCASAEAAALPAVMLVRCMQIKAGAGFATHVV